MQLSRTSSTRQGLSCMFRTALLAYALLAYALLQEGTKIAASATASVRVSVGPKFVAAASAALEPGREWATSCSALRSEVWPTPGLPVTFFPQAHAKAEVAGKYSRKGENRRRNTKPQDRRAFSWFGVLSLGYIGFIGFTGFIGFENSGIAGSG